MSAPNTPHERRYGVLYIGLIAFCLWMAFQGTSKNGVVGCADMPGGSNWDELTRPLR